MAEFIIGSPLTSVARRHRGLRRLLWWVDFAALWLIEKLALLLPVDASSRLGQRIGSWIGPRLTKKHRIFRNNFAVALPELNEQELETLTRNAWARAGRILAEYPHLTTILAEPERLQIEILAPVPTYADPSRPSVFVTAHLSNWEVVCSCLARLGIPNASLYSPPTNPLLDKMLLDSRSALNCELLPRDNSARALMRALREGRSAGMVMDRRVDDGKAVQFFGRDKLSTLMPAKLALKFDCELVPVHVERLQDARYRVTFHPPIRPGDRTAEENTQAVDMIQQVHQLFETWILARPEDWLCTKRLWAKEKKGKIEHSEETGHDADIDSYAA